MELTDVSEYLNVKQTTTAAASPNQNRRNERNHAVVDCMKSKIMEFGTKNGSLLKSEHQKFGGKLPRISSISACIWP